MVVSQTWWGLKNSTTRSETHIQNSGATEGMCDSETIQRAGPIKSTERKRVGRIGLSQPSIEVATTGMMASRDRVLMGRSNVVFAKAGHRVARLGGDNRTTGGKERRLGGSRGMILRNDDSLFPWVHITEWSPREQ